MGLYIEYEAEVGGAFEDVTQRFRRLSLDVTVNAEEGSVALSNMLFDDPDGDYDFTGWRRIHVYETEEDTGLDLIYSGWVGPRTISRGDRHRTGAARVWNLSMADFNSMIEMRVFSDSEADRPAETDVERIQWLMTTNEMSRILDDTYISTASPKNMDADDARGQHPADVIRDCADASGKNYFVISAHDAVDRGLFYDFASSPVYDSTLLFSNVIADVDNDTTFYLSLDAELERRPDRVYSGAFLRYDGGDVYEEDFTTSGIFTRRDAVYDEPHVHSETKATARALRKLSASNDEEDRITFAAYLPRNRIGHVKAGQRVQFKASHLPGYQSFTWQRVLQMKILEVSEGFDQAYLVTLTLGSTPAAAACSTAGGTLIIHTLPHPDFPDETWAIATGPAQDEITTKVTGIPAGDYTYSIEPGECYVFLTGEGGGAGVPFDGVTWTPTGGSPTYYPENGDGSGGHFLTYANSFAQVLGSASTWSFPVYGYAGAGGTDGVTDYGLGLNNAVLFLLP